MARNRHSASCTPISSFDVYLKENYFPVNSNGGVCNIRGAIMDHYSDRAEFSPERINEITAKLDKGDTALSEEDRLFVEKYVKEVRALLKEKGFQEKVAERLAKAGVKRNAISLMYSTFKEKFPAEYREDILGQVVAATITLLDLLEQEEVYQHFTRAEILEDVGIANLMEEVRNTLKDSFDSVQNPTDEQKKIADILFSDQEALEAVFYMAKNKLFEAEKLKIGIDTESVEDEDEGFEIQDGEIHSAETESPEHWMLKSDTISSFNSMSRENRSILYKLTTNEVGILGLPSIVDTLFIHQQLMELRGESACTNSTEFLEALERLDAKKCPWATQLVEILKDNPYRRTSFFNVYRRNHLNYNSLRKEYNGDTNGSVYYENGNRDNPEISYQIYVAQIYDIEEPRRSLFDHNGDINQKRLAELQGLLIKSHDYKGVEVPKVYTKFAGAPGQYIIDYWRPSIGEDPLNPTEEEIEEKKRDFINTMNAALNLHMSDIEKDDLMESGKFDKFMKAAINLVVNDMPKAKSIRDLTDNHLYAQHIKALTSISRPHISLADRKSPVEKVYRFNGSTYVTHTICNHIGDLLERLSKAAKEAVDKNDIEVFRKFLIDNFLKCRIYATYNNGEYTIHNMWLRKLYESSLNDLKSDKSFLKKFTENLERAVGMDEKDFKDFTENENYILCLNSYLLTRRDTGGAFGRFPLFVTGDSNSTRFLTAPILSVEEVKSALVEVAKQEMERMVMFNDIINWCASKDYKAPKNVINNKDKFTNLSFLNKLSASQKADLLDKYKKDSGEFERAIEEYLNKYLNEGFDTWVDKLRDEGDNSIVGSMSTAINSRVLTIPRMAVDADETLLREYYLNYKLATIQQLQLLTVDPGFYDGTNDMQKRYKEMIAAGTPLDLEALDPSDPTKKIDDNNGRQDVVYVQEQYFKSDKEALTALEEAVGPNGRPLFDVSDYEESTGTDGQAWRSFRSYRKIMVMLGKWTPEMEEVWNIIQGARERAKADGTKSRLNKEELQRILDLGVVFQPIKPFYYGTERLSVKDGGGEVHIPVQHKCSEFPIIPELLPEGNPLAALGEALEDNSTGKSYDLAICTSAVKVGNFGAAKIDGLKETSQIREALDKGHRHELSLEGWREQSNVPEHADCSRARGTQLILHWLSNLAGSAIKKYPFLKKIFPSGAVKFTSTSAPVDVSHGLNEGTLLEFYNHLASIGFVRSAIKGVRELSDPNKMSDLLSSLKANDSREANDGIDSYTVDEKGEMKLSPSEGLSAKDNMAMLLSWVRKNIIKQGMKGGSLVQVSTYGFQDVLKVHTEKTPEGKTNITYADCVTCFDFSVTDENGNLIKLQYTDYVDYATGNLLKADGTAFTDEEIEELEKKGVDWRAQTKLEHDYPGILDTLAYRIPTEGHCSILNLKARKFLPITAGAVVIVPALYTKIAGFDFDIDKLYFVRREYKAKKLTREQKNKKINKIWNAIYGKPDGPSKGTSDIYKKLTAVRRAAEEANQEEGEGGVVAQSSNTSSTTFGDIFDAQSLYESLGLSPEDTEDTVEQEDNENSETQQALRRQVHLIFTRYPELSKYGTEEEYLEYVKEIFPDSVDKSIYWHGSDADFSEGFKTAVRGEGSGAPETKDRNDLYLARQAWTVLQYVSGVNRTSVDKNGFAHWNKLWWEFKQIMSNGRNEDSSWKDLVISEDNVRQAIPNKAGEFDRDSGGEHGKWLKERKADYGYEDKSDKEFFEEILGVKWGEDTFNTWTQRNAEIFKSLESSTKGIYPAVINTANPIRESGQKTDYKDRGVISQATKEGNDAILSESADNEFNSDVAVVLDANADNVHFLGTSDDIKAFQEWKSQQEESEDNIEKENKEHEKLYQYWEEAGLTEETGMTASEYFEDFYAKHFRELTDFLEYDESKPLDEQPQSIINNILFDLYQARLEDYDTFQERYTPSGFQKLKDAKPIMLAIRYAEAHGLKDRLAACTTFKELCELAKEFKNYTPEYDATEPSTLVHYQTQNALYDKLIGIAANQNINQKFTSLMEIFRLKVPVKWGSMLQSTDSGMGKDVKKRFMNTVNPQTGQPMSLDTEASSKENLAASVDAVKDALLEFFGMTIKNFNLASFMGKIGATPEDIGMLLNQPIVLTAMHIMEISNKFMDLSDALYQALIELTDKGTAENTMLKVLPTMKDAKSEGTIRDKYVTLDALTRSIAEYVKGSRHKSDEFINTQAAVIALLQELQAAATVLSDEVNITKSTSVNSVQSDFGSVEATEQRAVSFAMQMTDENFPFELMVTSLRPELAQTVIDPFARIIPGEENAFMDKFMKSSFGMAQAAYSAVMTFVDDVIARYFPYRSMGFRQFKNILATFTNRSKLNADIINAANKFFPMYCMEKMVPIFMDNHKPQIVFADGGVGTVDMPNKIFYKEFFPEFLMFILEDNQKKIAAHAGKLIDYSKIPILEYITPRRQGLSKGYKNSKVILKADTIGALKKEQKDVLIESWEQMFKSEDPILRNLAEHLFMYSYYVGGFDFGPTTFMSLVPLELKTALGITEEAPDSGYAEFFNRLFNLMITNDTSFLREMGSMGDTLISIKKAIKSFLANNCTQFTQFSRVIYKRDDDLYKTIYGSKREDITGRLENNGNQFTIDFTDEDDAKNLALRGLITEVQKHKDSGDKEHVAYKVKPCIVVMGDHPVIYICDTDWLNDSDANFNICNGRITYYKIEVPMGKDCSDVKLATESIDSKYYIGTFTKVPTGQTLTAGKTYFTSNTGEGQFIANGTELADNSTFEGSFTEATSSNHPDSKLRADEVYFTTDTGEGRFIANGSEKVGKNYNIVYKRAVADIQTYTDQFIRSNKANKDDSDLKDNKEVIEKDNMKEAALEVHRELGNFFFKLKRRIITVKYDEETRQATPITDPKALEKIEEDKARNTYLSAVEDNIKSRLTAAIETSSPEDIDSIIETLTKSIFENELFKGDFSEDKISNKFMIAHKENALAKLQILRSEIEKLPKEEKLNKVQSAFVNEFLDNYRTLINVIRTSGITDFFKISEALKTAFSGVQEELISAIREKDNTPSISELTAFKASLNSLLNNHIEIANNPRLSTAVNNVLNSLDNALNTGSLESKREMLENADNKEKNPDNKEVIDDTCAG